MALAMSYVFQHCWFGVIWVGIVGPAVNYFLQCFYELNC